MSLIPLIDLSSGEEVPNPAALEHVSRMAAAPRKALSRLAIEGEGEIFGEPMTWRAVPIVPEPYLHGAIIDLRLGDLPITAAIDLDFQAEPTLSRLPDLDLGPDALALALEHLLTPDIEGFEAQFQTDLTIDDVMLDQPLDAGDAVLAIAVSRQRGRDFTALIWSADNTALADALTLRFPRAEDGPSPHLQAETVIVGPLSEMDRPDLAALEVGAVICPSPEWHRPGDEAYLIVQNAHIVPLLRHGDDFVAAQEDRVFLARDAAGAGQDGTMTEDARTGSMADPPVTLTIELHRSQMTLSELNDLRNQDILDLELDAVEMVTLSADGKPFAEGKLVQLDDVLGAMITKIL